MSLQTNRERYAADLAYQYDLTLPQGRRLAELAIHSVDRTFAPDSPAHLADPAVADAFVFSPLGPYATEESVDHLDDVARDAIGSGYVTAGAWFLRACVAEHRGDLDAQQSHLETSLAIDPAFWPSLESSGFLAFVEGDARRAADLLAASPKPAVVGMLHTLSHYAAPGPHPLAARVIWLWEKAATWLHRVAQHGLLVWTAADVAGIDDPLYDEAELVGALAHPLIESAVLLEFGLLDRFLGQLGALLPRDERQQAWQWAQLRHSVWRVEDTTPGSSLRVVDLATGRSVDAVNGEVSRCTEPGEVFFGAVLPAGDAWILPCHPVPLDAAAAAEITSGLGVEDPADLVREAYWRSRDLTPG